MHHFTQLSIEEREKTRVLLEKGLKPAEITRKLGRAKSTITREIKRNVDEKGNYAAHKSTEKKYEKRKRKCGAKKKLEKTDIREYIIKGLENR